MMKAKKQTNQQQQQQQILQERRGGGYFFLFSSFFFGFITLILNIPSFKLILNNFFFFLEIVWVGSMLFLAMGKTKYVVVALKLAKFPTLFSMFASSLLYSFVFGPAFGVGLLTLYLF